jgi:hypothetical protein
MFNKNTSNLNELLTYYSQISFEEKKAIIKSYTKFNEHPLLIQQFIRGSVLGDLHIRRRKPSHNARLSWKFGPKHEIYGNFSFKLFSTLGYCNERGLTQESFYHKQAKKIYTALGFDTFSFVSFNELHDTYYIRDFDGKRRKIIPFNIKELFQEPFSLAVLIQDDGYFNIGGGVVKIATNCFSLTEQNLLVSALADNYNLNFNVIKHRIDKDTGKIEYVLYLPKKQVPALILLVKEHMIPSMWYKLGLYEDGSSIPLKSY